MWRGREDDVVKILGRKVSLEEVGEGLGRALLTPAVCVLEAESHLLHAFVKSAADLTETSVLAAARLSLSAHQLPARVSFLPEFPLTEHGKTDLRRLRDIAARAGASRSRSCQVSEREIGVKCGELWESLLGSAPAGQDNFLAAGGDSFSALALVNSLGWEQRGVELSFSNFSYFSSHFLTPSSLLDILLTGTFLQFKAAVISANSKTTEDSEERSTLKREHSPVLTSVKNSADKKLKSEVFCKSRGRWTDSPPELPGEKSAGRKGSLKTEVIWAVNLKKCLDSSPLLVVLRGEEFIVASSHSGLVVSVRLRTGEAVWLTTLQDRVESSPVFDPGTGSVLVGCYDHHVYSLDFSDGATRWAVSLGGLVKCSPLVVADTLLCGSYETNLVVRLRCEDGREVWRRTVEGSVLASPVMAGEAAVIVATLRGLLYKLSLAGEELWRLNLGFPVFGTPLVSGHTVLVPCVNKTVYRVNSETGQCEATLRTEAPVFSSPILLSPHLAVFGCQAGSLYTLSLEEGGEGGEGGLRLVSRTELEGGGVTGAVDSCDQLQLLLCATTTGVLHLLQRGGQPVVLHSHRLPGEVFSSPLIYQVREISGLAA